METLLHGQNLSNALSIQLSKSTHLQCWEAMKEVLMDLQIKRGSSTLFTALPCSAKELLQSLTVSKGEQDMFMK